MTSTNASSRFGLSVPKRFLQIVYLGAAFCGSGLTVLCRAADATTIPASGGGTVTGIVTNKTTGNGLEGAIVAVPNLGLSTLVDNTGRFVLNNVPPGTHEVVVSYTGLDENKATVIVGSGQRVAHDFELSNAAYLLDTYRVAGEREGYAAGLTAQRNASNVKNVVSMDAYGNLPNLNATELVMRLPGVTFSDPGEEVVEGVSIRGQGLGSNTITIDGGQMASYSARNRQTRMTAFTGAMFESLELIKGQTPDQGADSLGGRVNFKTKSPLSMREKRRVNYTLSAVIAAPFTEQIPLREAHRMHPLFNVSYQEKFQAFGSEEANVAISVNAFYSENAFGYYETTRDFQQTNSTPAFLWDYRTRDNYNVRKQRSLNTKIDYRVSPNSKLSLSLIYSDAPEPMRRQYDTRAFAGSQTTVPSATTGVVPGFTDRVTTVQALPLAANANSGTTPTSLITQTSTLINRDQRLRHVILSGEHHLSWVDLDWASDLSRLRYRTLGGEGQLVNRIGAVPVIGPNGTAGSGTNTIVGPNGETGVGWILDRTQSDLYPRFIQNGGLDFTNPNNYRPQPNGLSSNSGDLDIDFIADVRGNATVPLPISLFTASLKSGFDVRDHVVSRMNVNRHRWNYIGTGALPSAPSILSWSEVKTGRHIPIWEAASFIRNGQPIDPSLWQEDRYFNEQNKYTGFERIQEKVYAAYVMTQGKVGNTGFLAGVRGERTDTEAQSFVRTRVQSTTAQQLADPVGAARADYANNFRTDADSYTQYFPSVHVFRNFTPNLKGRISWSTGFGRPAMNNALPTETVSETNQTVTVGNPGLLPQQAKNWDVTAEYYFKNSGVFSVGWFHKTIKDYIVSGVNVRTIGSGPDNGFAGQYEGFAELTTRNAGLAIASGWEVSYSQQLRFLPGLLKTLSVNANYSLMDTHGQFSGTQYLSNDTVSNFIPKTANLSLSWSYRKFDTRVLYNYSGRNLRGGANFAQPSRNIYMMSRETVNLGVGYQLRPNLKVQLDVQNFFNEPQTYYRGIPDQVQQYRLQPTKITVGMQGQF